MEPVTAVIPSLGRESLSETMLSLIGQSEPMQLKVNMGESDTFTKIRDSVKESETELVAICDDDAYYPPSWVRTLSEVFTDPKVGFAGGPCLPWLTSKSSATERTIAEVTTKWFGTSNMSYRYKKTDIPQEVDELNVVGNGLYRRDLLAQILEAHYEDVSPAAWETYVFTLIRQKGFKLMYCPEGYFYHSQRKSLVKFARQIFRSGLGRMNFFKEYPGQLRRKGHLLLPLFFDLYLFTLPLTRVPILILFYLGILSFGWLLADYRNWRVPLFYFVLHFSYGLGLLVGLFRNQRFWK